MDRHISRTVRLGATLCLFASALLLFLAQPGRCGAGHPVISSSSKAAAGQQQQQQATNTPGGPQPAATSAFQLGRSHQPPFAAGGQLAGQKAHQPPNLPSLPGAHSSSQHLDDSSSSAQQQQAISMRSAAIQKLQPAQRPGGPAAFASSQQQQQQQQLQALQLAPTQQLSQMMMMIANPYTNATHMLLLDLRQQLITRALKFDEHFRSLLTQSKLSLHNMFVDTYGLIYVHNTEIFTSMYEDLEQYYATGRVKLTKSMENFFERLYQKIFQVYNSNRAYSVGYLECATEQLAQLKPFKDAPDKLIGDIRHAFVAARTFNQALNAAIDIIKSIISLGSPPQCTSLISEKLLRQQQQQQQDGTRVPCLSFCEQVISRCIGRGNLELLNNSWRAYVVALGDLAKKLSVQYNIETIIGPIDVQISEAIMNFQENAQNITDQVSQACKPRNQESQPGFVKPPAHNRLLNKRAAAAAAPSPTVTANSARRNVNQQPAYANHHQQQADEYSPPLMSSYDSFRHQGADSGSLQKRAGRPSPAAPQTNPSAQFESLEATPPAGPSLMSIGRRSPLIIGEIRDYMLSTKNFWSSLPNSVCTSNYTQLPVATSSLANHLRRNSAGCFSEPLGLSDMNTDLRYRSEIQQQIHRLDAMHAKLMDAQRGVEIDWSAGPEHTRQPAPPASYPTTSGAPIATSSSSPTAMPDPIDDQDPDDPLDLTETGSGEDPDEPAAVEDSQNSSDNEDPEDEEVGEKDDQEEGAAPAPSLAPPGMVVPTQPPSNGIDLPSGEFEGMKPNIDLNPSNEGFITPGDQSPQKSGASARFAGSLLVILQTQPPLQLLLGLFSLCALSVVNTLHSNHRHNFGRPTGARIS